MVGRVLAFGGAAALGLYALLVLRQGWPLNPTVLTIAFVIVFPAVVIQIYRGFRAFFARKPDAPPDDKSA